VGGVRGRRVPPMRKTRTTRTTMSSGRTPPWPWRRTPPHHWAPGICPRSTRRS
jgi:hypothetical protein